MALPYTLTNGTTADATQAQGNDQYLDDRITSSEAALLAVPGAPTVASVATGVARQPNPSRPTLVTASILVSGSGQAQVFVGPTSSPATRIADAGAVATPGPLQFPTSFLVPAGWYYEIQQFNATVSSPVECAEWAL